MAGDLQPLDVKFPIVGEDGRPTIYFVQWAQQRQIDIAEGITADQALVIVADYIAAHPTQWGSIGGVLSAQLDLQAALDGKLTVVDDSGTWGAGAERFEGPALTIKAPGPTLGASTFGAGVAGSSGFLEFDLAGFTDGAWIQIDAATPTKCTFHVYGTLTGWDFEDRPTFGGADLLIESDLTIFDASNDGLAPASGGGTLHFLRADGSWVVPPGASYVVFTAVADGLAPASGGGTIHFLRADGAWVTPPNTTYAVFTSVADGLVPLSGGGTVNFLRADGSWAAPPGASYVVFTSVADGLTPASGGGTIKFLRADGTWVAPPGTTYVVFTSVADGLVPASGGGTLKFLRADGTWVAPPGTTYSVFTSVANGLVPLSGGGTAHYLRADGSWTTPPGTAPNLEIPATAPGVGNFTSINPGTGVSLTAKTYGVLAARDATSSAQISFAADNTAPNGVAFTATARIVPTDPLWTTGYAACLIARNSTNGRIVIFGQYNNDTQTLIQNWTSFSAFNANVVGPTTFNAAMYPWKRIRLAGGTLFYELSPDGDVWTTFGSATVASFLTAAGGGTLDQVGFGNFARASCLCQSWTLV